MKVFGSLALVLILCFLGIGFSGFVVVDSSDLSGAVQVKSFVEPEENFSNAYVGVYGRGAVVAFLANLSDECYIYNYSLSESIDVFEFKQSENIFVFANKSDAFFVNLSFSMPAECNLSDSSYLAYVSEGFVDDEKEIVAPSPSSTSSSRSSSGGGGGGSSPISSLVSEKEIIQNSVESLDSEESFADFSEFARNLVKFEGKTVDYSAFFMMVGFGVLGLLLLIVLVFMFLRRPENKFETHKKVVRK